MLAQPSPPRVEHLREPLGIGTARPRLTWSTVADNGWRQVAYEIELVRSDGIRRIRSESAEQVLVRWPDRPLISREQVTVRVRVIGADGVVSNWSDPTSIEAGLLEPTDWLARPVGGAWAEVLDTDSRRPSMVRREFSVGSGLKHARLYVTAHGLYEVELNGARVGRDTMSPGWTVYDERLRYTAHDVTGSIVEGGNALGALLADGWYRGRLGWGAGHRNLYGTDLALIAQLELLYDDGRVDVVASDASWTASVGGIISSGVYDGETHDARLEQHGWSSPGFDDSGWSAVRVGERDPATLVAPDGPPVRATEVVFPVSVTTAPSGASILDFGQNLVGRVRITVVGEAGDTIVIRTAEVIQDGEIYTRPLRAAQSTDRYILAGKRKGETWEPRFTLHGFRYAEITGWPGDVREAVDSGAISAVVYHTDMERTGWFESSNSRLNRLHENVVWSLRGNFVDIPTDCPQRDERLGWTGDLQVFAPTASYLFDVSGMLTSWLKDVAVEQRRHGTVPWYVPVIPGGDYWTPVRPGAVWGDVAVLTPWVLFERFADRVILENQYESARAWVDQVATLAGASRLWDSGFQLGDWLDPAAPPDDPAEALTDRYLVATAYFAWSASRLAEVAGILGYEQDAAEYATMAAEVRAAFMARWGQNGGVLTNEAQTAYALAICFGLVTGDNARVAGARLASLVAEGGNHIGTGFAGVNLISDALTMTGNLATAYDLLLESTGPSWLSMVDRGATTMWERWDSMLADGTVNSGDMTSFNHYALGSVADWMHRVVGGLEAVSPGYRRVRFAPRPGGGLTHASTSHLSPYGLITIEWHLAGRRLTVDAHVPSGVTGVIDIAGHPQLEIGPGEHHTVWEWE